ncbi:hypothetical protein RNZ50_02880 [Paracoccaceae bacterium Fryx2]|nr:hypothetical protein [Paracoccaceae bacterium Fryx2]
MTRRLFALSFGVAALAMVAQVGHANPGCAPRKAVLAQLSDRYGETRQAVGLAGGTGVMEMFASAEHGSWTISITLPDGTTCIVASGQGFESVVEPPPPEGDPA